MEEQNPQLASEVKRLNDQINELRNSGKFMLYSANPFKFALMNFLAGIFHTLGTLFGYIVVFGAVIFFFSKINLQGLMTKWVENTLGRIDWEKVMPSPQLPKGINLEDFDLPTQIR